jgi:phosphonate transport system permease protein
MTAAPDVHPIRAHAREVRADLEARYPGVFKVDIARRATIIAVIAGLVALFVFGFWMLEFSFFRILNGLGQLGFMAQQMWPPEFGTTDKLASYMKALAETVAIAFLGTLGAAILAFPLGFLAAKNVMASRVVHFLSRRMLDSVRGVDTLIWALIWINVVGLGPFAGVLAVMTSDIGSFGKLFSEAIENADRRAGEGVTSTGGGWAHNIRFGIIPEVFPVIASQVLYYFESNTRSATIIGIVGAGGIGLHLSEQIRTLEWNHVSFLILMILVTVGIIDAISTKLRFALIGNRETQLA